MGWRRSKALPWFCSLTAHAAEMLAKDTGQPFAQIEADQRAAKRFDAQQALGYGLIDRIEH